MKFTQSQQEAINCATGNLQLIACAGSGKTEVVARRVVKLLANASLNLGPQNILAFTFTDRAAAELKERITSRCRQELGDMKGLAEMFVGTIHSFCLDLLTNEVPRFLKYEVLNEMQQALLVDRNSKKSGLTNTRDLRGQLLRRYVDTSRYVEALSILREAQLNEEELKGTSIMEGLEVYRKLLASKAFLDYSSIMEEALAALREDKSLRQRVSARLRYVIVDEYQDINPLQESLILELQKLGANVCVVGDDDQTIYQWRGSDISNILSFSKRYPTVTQIRLEENFRSSKPIVEIAREFIRKNEHRLEKGMISTGAQPNEPGDVVAMAFGNPEAEALWIGKIMKQLQGVAFNDGERTRGLTFSDCAILLRSVRTNGKPIMNALRASGIPFIMVGMNNLFDTPEAEAARQLFYFMANRPGITRPHLRRAWEAANLGIASACLEKALDHVEEAKVNLATQDQKRWSVYSLQRQFLSFLEASELREEKVPKGRGEVVFYNLGKFSQVISDFETIHFQSEPKRKYEEFANFLRYRANGAYPEGWQDNQYANPNAVRIMTVHQAKGMQWPVVFLPALLRNRFPSAQVGGTSVWNIVPRAGIIGAERFDGSVEDERRLFYVAITRSQKFLFMTWASIAGKNNRYTQASEFWEAMLASKHVKRREPSFKERERLVPRAKTGIANVLFSFSDLKYFFECPYQFKLRILYGFNAPIHEALGYGKSLHNALAEIHTEATRGEQPDEHDVPKLVETHLHLPYSYPSLRETLRESAERVLEQYIRDNRDIFNKIEFAEKAVEITLEGGVTVTGRIDLVKRLDTNEITIVDLKSSKRAQSEDITEAQLHVYALGYQELTGRNADFVETYHLEERRRVPRSVDTDFMEDVKQRVVGAAQALRIGNLQPIPDRSKCEKCDFCKMCSAGARFAPKNES